MKANKTYDQIFKNHVAELKELDDDTQVLSFKDPNSKYYGAEFIFRNNNIFISGDTGWAVFKMSFHPTWDYSWGTMDTGYFSEKCKAFSDDKYVRSNEVAEETIKEHIIDMFKNNESTDGEEVADYIIWLARQKPFWDEIKNDDVFNEDNEDQFLKFAVLLLITFYISENQEQYIHFAIHSEDMKGFRDLRSEVDFSSLGEQLNSKFELWLYMLTKAKKQLKRQIKILNIVFTNFAISPFIGKDNYTVSLNKNNKNLNLLGFTTKNDVIVSYWIATTSNSKNYKYTSIKLDASEENLIKTLFDEYQKQNKE